MKSTSNLSPFEFKDILLAKAAEFENKHPTENASRGNPDFVATLPRRAMLAFGEFALCESERSYTFMSNLFGGAPLKRGIVNRWDSYVINKGILDNPGVKYITAALSFCEAYLNLEKDDVIYEWVMAYLGSNYPVPPRMLKTIEKITQEYLKQEMGNGEDFDLFATEGGTAAMTYLFQSMKINGLMKKGDKIAMITPIFTPYLEIPHLPMYDNQIIEIETFAKDEWQLTKEQVNKLKDQDIKLLCVVNPSNPSSVMLNKASIEMIKDIVEHHNKDLMIITDDVYGTFADDFKSLFASIPYNTALVYSFSKYFGATGWRLGTIAIHEKNIFDIKIANLDQSVKDTLLKHYHGLTQDIPGMKFIDRLVADSRAVALNHTAGLSLPQQLMMAFFSLNELLDNGKIYKTEAKRLIRHRYEMLYKALGLGNYFNTIPNNVGYYTVLDIKELARLKFNDAFAKQLAAQFSVEEFLLKLAEDTGVVLMPGDGFADTNPLSVRISLANLRDADYVKIGELLQQELTNLYKASKAKG